MWATDTILTNVFTKEYNNSDVLYSTKDIQLVNGCYYRMIVAYEQEIVTGTTGLLFVEIEDKEAKQIAEVYEFYAENSTEKALTDASSTPRKELGEKICVKKDTGYSEQITIDNKNPHYGWNLGTFSVNGYTRETTADGNAMFLKNAGDKVTLWFKLEKNIEDLDGTGKYSIVEDKNGSDQYFEIPATNFKHGALIIRYTDYEGVKHEPVIYTDFLAANATTGADTKAVLFEEGDYEVALDYTIGKSGLFGPENDYRIFFKFSIRNGNTMFFPFDLSTGAEMHDKAITSDGFTIDMAKSRYLIINVKRTEIKEGTYGHTEDVRFNGPAKDGEQYVEPGVYTVNVTNQYTGEETEKTFYVGDDPFLIAIAKSGQSVVELDSMLAQGYTIEKDGSLKAPPEPEPEEETEEETEEENEEETEDNEVALDASESVESETESAEDNNSPKTDEKEIDVVTAAETSFFEGVAGRLFGDSLPGSVKVGIIAGGSILVVIILCLIALKKRKNKKTSNKKTDEEEKGDKN